MIRSCLIAVFTLLVGCSSLLDPDAEVKNDNNGSIAQAEAITLGVQKTFTLSTRADVDFFKITLAKEGLIRIKCSQVPSNIAIEMELKDDEGTTVVPTQYTIYGNDDSIYYSANVGIYYLKINSRYQLDSSSKSISLIVNLDSVDTFETNNARSNAKFIEFDKMYYSKIIPQKDIDYFTFSLTKPSIVVLNIDSVSSRLQIEVNLQDNEGSYIPPTISASSAGSSLVMPKSLLAGTYYFSIKDKYITNFSDKPFVFKLTTYNNDTCEWNDNSANAKIVNGVMAGTIYPTGDIDFYSFSRSDSGLTTFTVDSVSSLIGIELTVYNSEKRTIASVAGNIGAKVTLSKALIAGDYFVGIKDKYDAYSDKKYYLTIKNN